VRALETERAMVRLSMMQRMVTWLILAVGSLNIGCLLAVTETATAGMLRTLMQKVAWFVLSISGFKAWFLLRRFMQLEKAEREGNLNEYVLESKRAAMGSF